MTAPPLRLLAAAALAALLLLGAGRVIRGCRESEEDRARAAVEAVIAAIEAQDVAGAVEPLSETYHDAEGLTRPLVRGYLLRAVFAEHKKISVRVEGEIAVRIRKDGLATAVFYARLGEGVLDDIALRGERWRFEVDLRQESGVWKIVTHRRERAQP
jgi:hypothetical protein